METLQALLDLCEGDHWSPENFLYKVPAMLDWCQATYHCLIKTKNKKNKQLTNIKSSCGVAAVTNVTFNIINIIYVIDKYNQFT